MSKKGPVPDKVLSAADAMKPNKRNPGDRYGRDVLQYAQSTMMVGDFGAPPGWPAQSPAKPTFTPGLPGEGKTSKKKEHGDPTIIGGIRRP